MYTFSDFHVGDRDPVWCTGALRPPVDAQAGAELPVVVVRIRCSHGILQHLCDDRPDGVHARGAAGAKGTTRAGHGRDDAPAVPRTTTNYQLMLCGNKMCKIV